MSPFSLTAPQSADSDLVMASLPVDATSSRVAVLSGSHAERVAVEKGFDTVSIRSIVQAPGLLESGEAAYWLEGSAEVAMVEMITGLIFTREALPAPRAEQLRQAWRAARSATQLKALYRAAGMDAILSASPSISRALTASPLARSGQRRSPSVLARMAVNSDPALQPGQRSEKARSRPIS